MKLAVIGCIALLAVLPLARGLVITGGTGTENFSTPVDDPGFANVAPTGVYLGNYGGNFWAITATHVGAGNLTLNSQTYNYVAGSAITVLNGNSTTSDLTLFRLATDPGLPTLALAAFNPGTSDIVRLVGDGLKENALTEWSVNTATNPDTWTVVGSGGTAAGYTETSGSGLRWGDAVVAGTGIIALSGSTATFYTEFLNVSGSTQGAANDSGGAVFGNVTYAASIADYNSFIVSAIPEPSTYAMLAGLLALGAASLARRRRGSGAANTAPWDRR